MQFLERQSQYHFARSWLGSNILEADMCVNENKPNEQPVQRRVQTAGSEGRNGYGQDGDGDSSLVTPMDAAVRWGGFGRESGVVDGAVDLLRQWRQDSSLCGCLEGRSLENGLSRAETCLLLQL